MLKLGAPDGEVLWQEMIDGPAHLDDRGWRVTVAADDHPVIAALAPTSAEEAAFRVVKLHTDDGHLLWTRDLPGAIANPEDRSAWLEALPGGDVVLAGRIWTAATSYDVILHRFAAADGAQVWHQQYGGSGTVSDDPRALALSAAGDHLLVAGVRAGDFLILRVRASDGGLVWQATYNGPRHDYDAASCVIEGPEQEVIAGGFSTGLGTGWDATVVAFEPVGGAQLWAMRYDAGAGDAEETTLLALNPQRDLFAGGYTYTAFTYSDMLTQRYALGAPAAVTQEGDAELDPVTVAPNPFHSRFSCAVHLRNPGGVNLSLYDAAGRWVAPVFRGALPAGFHRIDWPGGAQSVRHLPAGTYFVRGTAEGRRLASRIVRLP